MRTNGRQKSSQHLPGAGGGKKFSACDRNVLKRDCTDGDITINLLKKQLITHVYYMNFMVCK